MTSSNKDFLIILSIFGAVILGIIWLALPTSTNSEPSSSPASAHSGATLTAEESSYDFGNVSMAKGHVAKVYTVKNTTTEPVIVNKLYTSCMCTVAILTHGDSVRGPYGMQGHGFIPSFEEIIQPGESATVEATFDPNAHGPAGVGHIERVVVLETDGGALQLTFQADVTP